MSKTRLALQDWTYGQLKAETLGAQVLKLENYIDINPVHPTGGRDGGKDIEARHADGRKLIGACYFPNASDDKSWRAVKKKFDGDLAGAVKHSAKIFAFITNVPVTDGESKELRDKGTPHGIAVEVFDLERIVLILDHPRGFGLRYQILDLKMSDEEQVSFFREWESILLVEFRRLSAQVSQSEARLNAQMSSGFESLEKRLTAAVAQLSTVGGTAKTGDTEAIT